MITRRLGYLLLAINLSLLAWGGVIYGLASLLSSGEGDEDPAPTAGTE